MEGKVMKSNALSEMDRTSRADLSWVYTHWSNETIASLTFWNEVMLLDQLGTVRSLQASIETTLSQATFK